MDDDDSTERKYQYTYDGFGNLVEVTKPDANTIEYAYNGLNQMTQEKFDANNFNDFEYDCSALVKHQQTVGGSQENPFELTYDKMKRMTQEQYPDSANPKTEYFDYEYDQAGRRVEMTDPTYGRAASHPKPMRWSYDEDGKVLSVRRTEDDNYLSSQGEDYHVLYDDRGRIWKVFYPGDDNQPVMEVEYQYTEGGQIAKIIARNLTDGSGTDIYCQEFEYDENGRKIRQVQKEKESDADTAAYYVVSFSYDSRDMLVEEKYVRWNSGTSAWDNMYWARYAYDTAGNMTKREVDQIVNGSHKAYEDTFQYSRGYQLTQINRGENITSTVRIFTLTYDSNGNMTHISQSATFTDTFYNITEMEFQFDEKNRMTHYRIGGAGSYFQIKYDALGRVRERVNLTPTTTKYYSDGRQLIQQLDNSDNVDFDYFRGPTGLMRQVDVDDSNKKRFYIKDTLGTVLALVDPSNLSVKHYNYNAWGEHLDKDDTDFPTDTNLMRYIGCRVEAFGDSTAQTDAIYHLDHRHFLPSIGFLGRDPITLRILANDGSYEDMINCQSDAPIPLNDTISQRLSYLPKGESDVFSLNELPEILNSFMYSSNNPPNASDPSGLGPPPWNCCVRTGTYIDPVNPKDYVVWKIPNKKNCLWDCSLHIVTYKCTTYWKWSDYDDKCTLIDFPCGKFEKGDLGPVEYMGKIIPGILRITPKWGIEDRRTTRNRPNIACQFTVYEAHCKLSWKYAWTNEIQDNVNECWGLQRPGHWPDASWDYCFWAPCKSKCPN